MPQSDLRHGPRILVAGAGAIGCFLAATFQRAGLDVRLLARGTRLDDIRRNGVTLATAGNLDTVLVECIDGHCLDTTPDVLIVATKTYGVASLLDGLRARIAPGAIVLTLQNGVDAPVVARQALPHGEILAGRMHGFFDLSGHVVRHLGVAPEIAFGYLDGRTGPAVATLAGMFETAGIANLAGMRMDSVLWTKMLLASSLGGVAAALQVPGGQLRKDPGHWALLVGAMAEVARLASARGIDLPIDSVESAAAFVRTFPEDATTSLQRDLMAGLPSEYDALTGAVLRMGREMGIRLPVHDRIEAMLDQHGLIAARSAPSGRSNFQPNAMA